MKAFCNCCRLILLFLCPFVLYGQAVDCTTATNINLTNTSGCMDVNEVPVSIPSGTNSGVLPNPNCGGMTTQTDGWYKFTVPPGVTTMSFQLAHTGIGLPSATPNAGAMAFYTGPDCFNLTLIGCKAATYTTIPFLGTTVDADPSVQLDNLTPGTTVWVRLWDQLGNGQIGKLRIKTAPLPPGDNCNNPVPLTANGCNTFAGGGDVAAPEDCGWQSTENSVFYTFTVDATTPRPVSITISNVSCIGGGGDIQLAIYNWNGSCNGIGGSPATSPANNTTYHGCASGTGTVTITATPTNLPDGNYVLAVDGDAGANCSFGFSGPVVNFPPDAIFSAPTSVCLGQCITYTDQSTNNPTTWEWTFNGGTPATFNGKNPPQICYNTLGTFTTTLKATNADGFDTYSQQVTVVSAAPASISGIQANQCLNGPPVTLTGTPAGGTFSGPGVSGNTFNPAAAGTGTKTITYSGTNGCGPFSVTTTVNVQPGPTVVLTAPIIICKNAAPVTLTGSPSGGTFSGQGVTGSTFTPGSFPFTSGTHQIPVTYTVNAACGQASDTAIIILKVTETLTFTAPKTSFCAGDPPVTLTATPTGGTFSGPGVSGNTFTPANAGGTGTKTLTYTYNGQCGPVTKTLTMTITTGTTATVNLQPNYCVTDAAVTLSPTPSGANYTFAGPGITNATYLFGLPVNPATFNPATAGVGTHTITYSGPNLCTYTIQVTVSSGSPTATITPVSPLCSTSAPVTLTATPTGGTFSGQGVTGNTFNPAGLAAGNYTVTYSGTACGAFSATTTITVGSITVTAASPTTICPGGSAQLTASGATTYVWNPGNISGASINVTPVSTTTYTVIGTQNGCTGTASVTVTVNNNLTVTSSAAPATLCNGSNTTLTASGATTYLWQPGGLTGATQNLTPLNTTTYTVTGTQNGCTGTSTVTVTVNNIPTVTATAAIPTLCPGNSTGLTATGATTYVWNPGGLTGTSVTVTPAATTTYTVTGTSNGCSNTATVTVTIQNNLNVTASAAPAVICPSNSTTLTGTGAATYVWNPGNFTGTTVSVTPLGTTTYTVTGTQNGCTGTATVTVTVQNNLVVSASASSTAICPNGSTNLTGSGANTYLWNPGGLTGASVNVSPTNTTTYTVTGTQNGCTGTATVTITINPNPTISSSASPASICPNGSTTLSANGGVSYLWNPGGLTGASQTVSPTTTTTYTVVGTDASGCTNSSTVTVTVLANPTVSALAAQASICPNGSTTLTGSGATTYAWQPGGLTGTSVSVSPTTTTTYTVTGTNASSCSSTSTVTVIVLANPTVSAVAAQAAICPNASTNLSGSGATTYLWQPGNLTGTTVSVSPTANTTYTVTGTQNGCTATNTVTVSLLPNPIVTAVAAQPSLCPNGSTDITASGATTYVWNPGNLTGATINVTPAQTTTYTVIGTQNGCTGTTTVTVTVQPNPIVKATPTLSVVCPGASTDITASGATTYDWQPGGLTGTTITVSPLVTTTYTLTGTQNGCTGTTTVTISVQNNLVVNAIASPAIVCPNGQTVLTATGAASYVWEPGTLTGSSISVTPGVTTTYTVTGTQSTCTGSATVTVTQAAAPVVNISGATDLCPNANVVLTGSANFSNYLWSTGQTTQVINVGQAGNYILTATDANGCTATASATVTLSPTLTPTITIPVGADNKICPNETLVLDAGAGFGSYLWSPTGQTTQTITVTQAGQYGVTVTQAGSCPGTTNFVVVSGVNPTPSITGNLTICDGELTTLTAQGGTSYLWQPGGQTTPNITVSTGGVYVCQATNADGCSATAAAIVTANPQPVAMFDAPAAVCAGNVATIIYNGPNIPGQLFDWDFGGGNATSNGFENYNVVYPSLGNYTIRLVVSVNNCRDTLIKTIGIVSKPIVDAGKDQQICKGSSTLLEGEIEYQNGTGGCVYQWTTNLPANISDPTVLNPEVSPLVTTTYTLQAVCNGCVSNLDEVTIYVASPPILIIPQTEYSICLGTETAPFLVQPVGGTGGYDYHWLPITGLSNPNIPNPTAKPNVTTTYMLTVLDSAGCESNQGLINVVVNPLPIADAGHDAVICQGLQSGVYLNGVGTGGGFGSYLYRWSPGAGLSDSTIANPFATPDTTTIYTLTVISNQTGCSSATTNLNPISTVTIEVNPLPIAVAGLQDVYTVCEGGSVEIGGIPYGAGPTYTYEWSPTTGLSDPTAQKPIASPAFTTKYILKVTSNGCSSVADTVTVVVAPRPTIAAQPHYDICPGDSVKLLTTIANGDGPYTYLWSPADGLSDPTAAEPMASPIVPTTYTLRAFNAGCEADNQVSVTVDLRPAATVMVSPSSRVINWCPNAKPNGVTLLAAVNAPIVAGSPAPYTVLWSPTVGLSDSTSETPTARPTETTTYVVTVFLGGPDGCKTRDSITVVVLPNLLAKAFVEPDTAICAGQPITLTATGGFGSQIYLWNAVFEDGTTLSDTGAVWKLSPTVSGQYVLTLREGGCEDKDTVNIRVVPGAAPEIRYSVPNGCEGRHTMAFSAINNGVANGWEWDFGDGTPPENLQDLTHTFSQPGEYEVRLRVFSSESCSYQAEPVKVRVLPQMETDFTSEPTYDTGDTLYLPAAVQFKAETPGAVSFYWQFGDSLFSVERDPLHVYMAPGRYTVNLLTTDAHGCTSVTPHGLYIVEPPTLFIPNVFTPNGDGINDYWKPIQRGNFPMKYDVFDRWGNLVFTGDENSQGWRGADFQQGVYYYLVKYQGREYKGSVVNIK